MYKQYEIAISRTATNVNTRRNQQKHVFKTDIKIERKYENSPFFIGLGILGMN